MKSRLYFLLSLFTLSLASPAHAYNVTSAFKWDSNIAGVGASLTWAFAPNNSDCRVGGTGHCNPGEIMDVTSSVGNNVQNAFDAWANVADLTFSQTTSLANPDILIGSHDIDGPFNVVGHATTSFFAGSPFKIASISDIHLDTDDLSSSSLFNILAHEIGHSLGLGHTDIANSLMNPSVSNSFVGPQADDILGVQFLYGTPAAVPVPGAIWLMLTAFGVISLLPKRRKHINSAALLQV